MITNPSLEAKPKLYIFECNSETYLTCMEKALFGSNKTWPLEVKKGDYCLLHHMEAGTLLGIWKTASDGGRNLDARAWKGKFPYQEFHVDPIVGRFDNVVEDELATKIIEILQSTKA